MIHRSSLHEDDKTNSAEGMPSAGGTGEHQAAGHNRRGPSAHMDPWDPYSSLFRIYACEHDSSLPDHPARYRPFCRRNLEAISANHGVLDTPTVDASNCR